MSPEDDYDYEPPEVLRAREAMIQLKAARAPAPQETRKPRMDLFDLHLQNKIAQHLESKEAAKSSPADTNIGSDRIMRKPPCFWDEDGGGSGTPEAQVMIERAVASEATSSEGRAVGEAD
eukprot:1823058-Prymnesium_polylepis.1